MGMVEHAARRPRIAQIGQVEQRGHELVVRGFVLGLCLAACGCHRHPATGQPAVLQDAVHGRLGLQCYRLGGCGCCSPWSAEELLAVIKDFNDVAALQVVAAPEGG